jgi:gas vesicle protein GvpA/GvpJ/GvpM family
VSVTTWADESPYEWEQLALVDLLDRVLAAGVVLTGDITLSIAGVDLVYLSVNALLSSVRAGWQPSAGMSIVDGY